MKEYNPRENFEKEVCNKCKYIRICESQFVSTVIGICEYFSIIEEQNKQMLKAIKEINEAIKYTGSYESVKHICTTVFNSITGKKIEEEGK